MSNGHDEENVGSGEHGGEGEHPAGGEHQGGEHAAGSEHGEGEDGGPVATVADGVSEGLGAISDALGDGEENEDARRGLDAAGDASEAVGDGARTAQSIESSAQAFQNGEYGDGVGDIGNALGNVGSGVGSISTGLSNVVDDPETRRTLQEVARVANMAGGIARDVGKALDGAIDFISTLIGEAADVDYHLTITDCEGELTVSGVSLYERLGQLYQGTVQARTSTRLEERELIGKDVHLRIERGTEQRSLRGIVRSATVSPSHGSGAGYHVAIDVVPAMYLMAHTIDSRIYQAVTVPDLIEQLVQELVGSSRSRKVKKDGLTETYPPHEYLVQYRESHIEFLSRLCQEEGIFFYFDHDAEGEDFEVMVLADSNDDRPVIREAFDGRVMFSTSADNHRHEVATHVQHHQQIGATDSVVSGYDWSNPGTRIRQERTERGEWSGPPLEVHEHFQNVRHHDYSGTQYQSHTAERQARMRTERMDIARQRWTIDTTVVTAKPGHLINLEGSDDHDDRYLIVSVDAHGSSNSQGIGEYRNTLDVIPASMPYRPPPPERRPMPGPETATVVGESGEEITTDSHGRIHVQFHWDRLGENNEHSSAWIRVAQGWAGAGWGMMFIPRHGMEVLVQFLGGDPDRPVVTGCLYNGTNTPPYPLPADKTKSTIKTNSSLGGGGYNELRFEDKSGSEEVFIHAQKDFNEVVENNHSTHVKNNQRNTVDGNQTEVVGKDQEMTVKKNRTKVVKGDENTTIGPDSGNRSEKVHGDEFIEILKNRTHHVKLDDVLDVTDGKRVVNVNTGCDYETYKGGREVEVKSHDRLNVTGGAFRRVHVTGMYHTTTNGLYRVTQNETTDLLMDGRVDLKTDGDMKLLVAGKAANLKMLNSGKIELSAESEIYIHVNKQSYIKLTASGIEIEGPAIKINATSGNTEINASALVKLKCD